MLLNASATLVCDIQMSHLDFKKIAFSKRLKQLSSTLQRAKSAYIEN